MSGKDDGRTKKNSAAGDRTEIQSKKKKKTFNTVLFDKVYDEVNATVDIFYNKSSKWKNIIHADTCLYDSI